MMYDDAVNFNFLGMSEMMSAIHKQLDIASCAPNTRVIYAGTIYAITLTPCERVLNSKEIMDVGLTTGQVSLN